MAFGSLTAEQTYIASVVVAHWFISISMIYLNKALMSRGPRRGIDSGTALGHLVSMRCHGLHLLYLWGSRIPHEEVRVFTRLDVR
jgi:hypothetical protein